MSQVAALFERVHLVPYRGWRGRQGVLLHDVTRRDRRRGFDVVLDDELQNAGASV